jgi:hypothetical protein
MTADRTPEKLIKLLREQKEKLASEIRSLRKAHSVIAVFIDFMTEGLLAEESEIFVCERAERLIMLGELNEYKDEGGFLGAFSEFCTARHTPELNLAFPVGGYFDDMDTFLRSPSQPARFFSHDPDGKDIIAEGLYLTGYTRRYDDRANDLPERMVAYADKNGLTFIGPVYSTYLLDELNPQTRNIIFCRFPRPCQRLGAIRRNIYVAGQNRLSRGKTTSIEAFRVKIKINSSLLARISRRAFSFPFTPICP